MTRCASAPVLGSDFDAFLFASIGEHKNGMQLSVVSALARLDIDPWQEAARFARLPAERATQMLAALIAALPDNPSADLESRAIAARLVKLLPREVGRNIPIKDALFDVKASTKFNGVVYVILAAYALFTLCAIATHPLSARVEDQHSPAVGVVSAPMLAPHSAEVSGNELPESRKTDARAR
jgi:hypothetical protein